MAKAASKEPEITADVVAVYNEHVQVISELKKSQWQLVVVINAVLVGMLTFQDKLKATSGCGREFLPCVPFVVLACGLLAFYKLNKGLRLRRQRIKDGRLKLSPKAIEVFGPRLTEDPAWHDDWQLLMAGAVITFGLTWFVHLALR